MPLQLHHIGLFYSWKSHKSWKRKTSFKVLNFKQSTGLWIVSDFPIMNVCCKASIPWTRKTTLQAFLGPEKLWKPKKYLTVIKVLSSPLLQIWMFFLPMFLFRCCYYSTPTLESIQYHMNILRINSLFLSMMLLSFSDRRTYFPVFVRNLRRGICFEKA